MSTVCWGAVKISNIVGFLNFTATTYCRYGKNLCGVYRENFPVNQLVKEFWNSVHVCQTNYETSRKHISLRRSVLGLLLVRRRRIVVQSRPVVRNMGKKYLGLCCNRGCVQNDTSYTRRCSGISMSLRLMINRCLTHNDVLYVDKHDLLLLLLQRTRSINIIWICTRSRVYHSKCNKCCGDDTKAAARQSPNCILKIKKNKIWRKTIFNMADGILTPCNVARSWHWFRQVTAPSNVACGSGNMTVNSPSGSTLQRDTWLWDDMPLNSPGCSTLQCDT